MRRFNAVVKIDELLYADIPIRSHNGEAICYGTGTARATLERFGDAVKAKTEGVGLPIEEEAEFFANK